MLLLLYLSDPGSKAYMGKTYRREKHEEALYFFVFIHFAKFVVRQRRLYDRFGARNCCLGGHDGGRLRSEVMAAVIH